MNIRERRRIIIKTDVEERKSSDQHVDYNQLLRRSQHFHNLPIPSSALVSWTVKKIKARINETSNYKQT